MLPSEPKFFGELAAVQAGLGGGIVGGELPGAPVLKDDEEIDGLSIRLFQVGPGLPAKVFLQGGFPAIGHQDPPLLRQHQFQGWYRDADSGEEFLHLAKRKGRRIEPGFLGHQNGCRSRICP